MRDWRGYVYIAVFEIAYSTHLYSIEAYEVESVANEIWANER